MHSYRDAEALSVQTGALNCALGQYTRSIRSCGYLGNVMGGSDMGASQMRVLAVIETLTAIDVLQHILGGEVHLAAFRLEKCAQSPLGYPWFNVYVDGSHALDTMKTIRGILYTLLDAADRGLVEHFRIVIGADLLRQPARPARKRSETGGGPCVA